MSGDSGQKFHLPSGRVSVDPHLDLKVADIVTFLALSRHASVTAAARELRVTPSQVSKAIARLQEKLGTRLVDRRGRGVAITEEGRGLVSRFESVVETTRTLYEGAHTRSNTVVTVAGPSYLCAAGLPHIVDALPEDVRVRGFEASPSFIRGYADDNLFQVALSLGNDRMPQGWVSMRVAQVRRALFASPILAKELGKQPSIATLRAIPFVSPVYQSGAELLPADDGCPLPRSERTLGHEAATIGVALQIAVASRQLVFGPVVAAQSLLRSRELVEISVPGWRSVDELYVHVNADRLLARIHRAIVAALRAMDDAS
jgi:DNA-binding transcriptional LysR family regulator